MDLKESWSTVLQTNLWAMVADAQSIQWGQANDSTQCIPTDGSSS